VIGIIASRRILRGRARAGAGAAATIVTTAGLVAARPLDGRDARPRPVAEHPAAQDPGVELADALLLASERDAPHRQAVIGVVDQLPGRGATLSLGYKHQLAVRLRQPPRPGEELLEPESVQR
jgi:hypothetical protein